MALRTARFRPDGRPDRRGVRQSCGVAGLLLLSALEIALAGCSPIEAWRSLSGVNKNDPDPQTAPFSHNLTESEAGPYPNLASVPPPPVRATTAVERQRLTQALIADRAATAANAGPAPPRRAAGAKPAPDLPTATSASTSMSPAPKAAVNSVEPGPRAASEPSEPSPLDASLQMPELRSVPEPEATRPAPPLPALAAVPRAAIVAEPPAVLPASAMPQPAPPVPVLAPVPPPAIGKSEPQRPAATTVATLGGPGGVAAPNDQERSQIERVAALYKDSPGRVRVVAYAAAQAGGGDPLDSYRAALDRAQAVAKALARASVPASKILTEVAPAGAGTAGRVEIQFTQ